MYLKSTLPISSIKRPHFAILAGFTFFNRHVIIQGYHGTGKSAHVEQVAARLNWPCIRVNLDSHISRIDLIGKDAIVLKDGKQVTEFREGILPWALQHPCALVFDEYDAGRPNVMLVIQRVLEVEGKLTLLDQNRVIRPHPAFRLFATANTVGLGGRDRPLSDTADQPGPDGPLEYRGHAELTCRTGRKWRSSWPNWGHAPPAIPCGRSVPKAWVGPWRTSPAPGVHRRGIFPPSCRRAR